MAVKSSFKGKKSSFKLFGKIEFPSKRTKKACTMSRRLTKFREEYAALRGFTCVDYERLHV